MPPNKAMRPPLIAKPLDSSEGVFLDSQTFRLHLPFTTQSQYDLGSFGTPTPVPIPDRSVTFAGAPGAYVLDIDGFESIQAAKEFVPRAWLGLASLMLDVKTGFAVNLDAREGVAADVNPSSGLPPKFHGQRVIVDEGRPFIAPSDAKLITVGVGTVTLRVATGAERALAALARGMTHPGASALFADERFRTAVDLFAAAPFEERATNRLILLATALEVLAPPIPKHVVATDMLARWAGDLEKTLAAHPPGSEAAASLEALRRELIFRRDASIRMRIRQFVYATFTTASIQEAEFLAAKAVSAYDDRSTLVHDGALPPGKVVAAAEVLRLTLDQLFALRLAAV